MVQNWYWLQLSLQENSIFLWHESCFKAADERHHLKLWLWKPHSRPHLRSSWAAAYLKCQHKAPGTQPHAPGGESCCWSWIQLVSQQCCSQMVPFSLAETQGSPIVGIPVQQGRAEGKLQCWNNGFEVLHINPSSLLHLNAYNACFLR